MFDTMTITKAAAGVFATLLVFLVGKWVADAIYMPGHDAAHAHAVYPLPAEAEGEGHGAATEAPAEAVDVTALFASADAAAGEGQWRNCRSCHSLDAGVNGTGPSLHGVVGRAIDSVEGFNYSGALAVMGETWTVEALFAFLADPRGAAPGTRMTYAGLRNETDRINLIAYLATQGG